LEFRISTICFKKVERVHLQSQQAPALSIEQKTTASQWCHHKSRSDVVSRA